MEDLHISTTKLLKKIILHKKQVLIVMKTAICYSERTFYYFM
jgi:hypothetical protein